MRIDCDHGYFRIYPEKTTDVFNFQSVLSKELTQVGHWFTFKALGSLPWYSIEGNSYGGAAAIVTYSGYPWDVMRANGFVYNLSSDVTVPISSISRSVLLAEGSGEILSPVPVLQPGWNVRGAKITGYYGWLDVDIMRLILSRVYYE